MSNVFLGSCVLRDASGEINNTFIMAASIPEDCLGTGCKYGWDFSECIANKTCPYGLMNNYQVNLFVKVFTDIIRYVQTSK